MSIELRRYAGEPELFDPAKTGEFAAEMASLGDQPQVEPWCSYIAWRDGNPVGVGGFKGMPDADGAVEIGYLTFPDAERSGVATGLVETLLDIARHNDAASVLAHTLPEKNASTRVLEKCRFARVGWGEDDDVGAVWRWRYDLGGP